MNSFKVGDRVVCQLRQDPDWSYEKRIATVTGIMNGFVTIKYDAPDISSCYYRSPDMLMHDELYNSPLMKALR